MMKIDTRRFAKSLGTVLLSASLVFGTAACSDDDIEDPVEEEIEDEIQEGEQIEDAVEEEVIEEVEEGT
jgi:hypothetical protein